MIAPGVLQKNQIAQSFRNGNLDFIPMVSCLPNKLTIFYPLSVIMIVLSAILTFYRYFFSGPVVSHHCRNVA